MFKQRLQIGFGLITFTNDPQTEHSSIASVFVDNIIQSNSNYNISNLNISFLKE